MRALMLSILLLLAPALAACSQDAVLEQMTDPQDREIAVGLITAMRDGDLSKFHGRIHPEVRPALEAQMQQIRGFLPPKGEPRLIEARWQTMAIDGRSGTLKFLTYEIGENDRWSVVDVRIFESGGTREVVHFWVRPVAGQPSAGARFSLEGKSAVHYAWLVALAVSLLTCVTGAVLAFRNKALRWRWFWVLASLIAIVGFDLNWTTGAMSVQPIRFMLLGGSVTAPSAMLPWTVSFGLPVFAIVAIVKYVRRHRVVSAVFATAEPQPDHETD